MKDIVNRNLVNLENCDQEPIHIPGSIQSHGMLLALDDPGGNIRFCSGNSMEFLQLEPNAILGKNLSDLFGDKFGKCISDTTFTEGNSEKIDLEKFEGLTAFVHEHNGMYIIEIEPLAQESSQTDLLNISRELVSYLENTSTLVDLSQAIAEGTQKITGYDRVMIYRFDKNYNGEVIAEARRKDLEGFLGLHYPHTDIPAQARALYIRNQLRVLVDIDYTPVPIFTTEDATNASLDLSYASLRSISPIHVQYLHNMGVGATLTISLLHRGKLWGLIACHHYSPKFLTYEQRMSAKLLGHFITSQIDTRQLNEEFEVAKLANEAVAILAQTVFGTTRDSLSDIVRSNEILKVANATGVAIVLDGKVYSRGTVPDDSMISLLAEKCAALAVMGEFHTVNISRVAESLAYALYGTPGILYFGIDMQAADCILWFRPEEWTEVSWAGDPRKAIEKDKNGLSPRKSFEAWKEVVKGQSRDWYQSEIAAAGVFANTLAKHIGTIRLAEEEMKQRALAQELRETNAELENINWISTHDLQEPLRKIQMMGSFILNEEGEGLSDSVKRRILKMNEFAARMQTLIKDVLKYTQLRHTDQHFDEVDLNELVDTIVEELSEILKDNGADIHRTELPSVQGISFLLKQLFLNIIYNSLKFTKEGIDPEIRITAERVDSLPENNPDDSNSYHLIRIRDNGIGFHPDHKEKIFQIFSRLQNSSKTRGSGIGLALCRKIMSSHGGFITANSTLGEGAEFQLYFKIPSGANT